MMDGTSVPPVLTHDGTLASVGPHGGIRMVDRPNSSVERNAIMSNIETVKGVYAAFGRGDIQAIKEVIADDIEWEYGMADTGVPWLRSRTGRDGALKFFDSLAGVEFHTFDPRVLLEHDDVVVALIDVSFTVKDTGVVVSEEDEVHIWTFDTDGKVSRFCHKLDTHQHWVAVGRTEALETR
jgi:ketosteroid isomerase-like protein